MPGRRHGLFARRLAGMGVALACALLPRAAAPGPLAAIDPERVLAGSFYDGATLHVRGSIDERSQVGIRVIGPREHHHFNRRGKIGGLIWGGIEHVTFHHAPSLYAVYTSAALGVMAPRAVRDQLQLGYETLEARMEVEGTRADKAQLIEQLVRLKESEGLYRMAPGAVRLADAERGRRAFEVALALPATASPGDIEVAVFELADGVLVGEDTVQVKLQRVGMPAWLMRLSHAHGVLFGLLAVFALVTTGLGVDLLGSRKAGRRPHPAVVMLVGLARGVDDALLGARHRPRSHAEVERMHAKYRLFRALLALNNELLQLLAELEEESSWTSFHHARVRMGIRALFDGTADMVRVLNELTAQRYFDLVNVVASLRTDVWKLLEKAAEREASPFTLTMGEIGSKTADLVGDKTVNLARIECDLAGRVPESFAVTIEAYREFLEAGGLASQLRTILAPARLDAPDDFRRRCEMAQDLVVRASVPQPLIAAIQGACRACGFTAADGLAVRSSAAGEGSELSFAGQFETVLNVPASGLVEAWKKVVASRFSPGAVFYRRAAGLADVDTPMAVLVQRMVRARASGVLFTQRPDHPRGDAILVTAGRGLGPDVSAGIADADHLVLSRAAPHRVLERRIARKAARLVCAEEGGLAQLAVEGEQQLQPAISDAEAFQLAATAMGIERYFGRPQDIEWVFDADGHLYILQARPLRIEGAEAVRGEVPRDAPLLLRGGHPVWPGRAVGPVHVARTPREEEETPTGALLVVPQLLPDCVRLLPRVCGIVAERGTVTGHAASILREFRVPSLFGVAGALEKLAEGRVVSLDVASRGVFDGAVWPDLRGRLPVTLHGRQAMGLPDLLAGKLTKLSGSAFVGTWACQSLHDVIRFAHERAIQAMFDMGDRLLESRIGGVKTVDCPPPLYVHVVDLGSGLRPEAASKESVKPEEIVSVPFQALWRGLSDPHFNPQLLGRPGPAPSGAAPSMVLPGRWELGSPNYACITDSYLNLNARAGVERDALKTRPRRQAYHYVVVDSFLSENQNENHVRMRFRGGGAAPRQRRLRAEFAAEVLRRHHFTATVTGDLLNGWVQGIDRAAGAEVLATIGHLLRALPRLDMWMTDEADVKRTFDAFVESELAALNARTGARGIASG